MDKLQQEREQLLKSLQTVQGKEYVKQLARFYEIVEEQRSKENV